MNTRHGCRLPSLSRSELAVLRSLYRYDPVFWICYGYVTREEQRYIAREYYPHLSRRNQDLVFTFLLPESLATLCKGRVANNGHRETLKRKLDWTTFHDIVRPTERWIGWNPRFWSMWVFWMQEQQGERPEELSQRDLPHLCHQMAFIVEGVARSRQQQRYGFASRPHDRLPYDAILEHAPEFWQHVLFRFRDDFIVLGRAQNAHPWSFSRSDHKYRWDIDSFVRWHPLAV